MTLYHCYFSAKSEEYITVMKKIQEITKEHQRNMKLGEPQFNYCDLAVQVCVH